MVIRGADRHRRHPAVAVERDAGPLRAPIPKAVVLQCILYLDVLNILPELHIRLAKLKETDGSNKSLLGDGSEATERRLKGLPVAVAATVPDDLRLVVDRRAILSAYGSLQLGVSLQVGFRKDTIVTRLTWRIGAVIAHPERVVELWVGEPTRGRGRRPRPTTPEG